MLLNHRALKSFPSALFIFHIEHVVKHTHWVVLNFIFWINAKQEEFVFEMENIFGFV